MLKSTEVRQVLFVVLFLSLAFLLVQGAWETRDGLAFPDHHSPNFLGNALNCLEWLQALPSQVISVITGTTDSPNSRAPALCTGDYPPLSFLVSGLSMALFGPTVAVARQAQVLFVVGTIGAMGWLGWQVAGRRGAVLLALGIATAAWTSHFVRIYCLASGQMFVLALMLALALDSEGLTRTRRCVALGVTFGLGMLVKYSVLLLGVPIVLLAALPRLLSTGRSRFGLLLFLLLADLVFLLTWWGIWSFESRAGGDGLLVSEWPLILGSLALFAVALASSVALGRQGSSGRGLLLVAAVGGLVCAPWYFSRMDLWSFLIPMQYSYAPVVSAEDTPLPATADAIWMDGMFVVATFYWGGPAWLAVGTLALLSWKARFRQPSPGPQFSGDPGHPPGALDPDPRYLASVTPVLVVLSFLWAARWRASFVACTLFMLLAGVLQTAAWTTAAQTAATFLHLAPITEIVRGSSPPPLAERPPLLDLGRVPAAQPPSSDPSLLEAVPDGASVGILWVGDSPSPGGLTFIQRYLEARGPVVEVSRRPATWPDDLDYLLLASDEPIPTGWGKRHGIPSKPRRFRVTVSQFTNFFKLYRLNPPLRSFPVPPREG